MFEALTYPHKVSALLLRECRAAKQHMPKVSGDFLHIVHALRKAGWSVEDAAGVICATMMGNEQGMRELARVAGDRPVAAALGTVYASNSAARSFVDDWISKQG